MKIFARFIVALLCLPPPVLAATTQFRQGVNGYTGTVDTYLRADQPTNQFANAAIVLVDNDNPIAHGLIRFDNMFGNGPGQIPSDSSTFIDSARLTLRTSNDGDPVWFHRMLVPWAETNNWNELSTSGPGLQADGIEMVAVPDFTYTGSTPIPRFDTFDVTATVQGWLAGDFPNYGWGITNQMANGWQFDSSANTNVSTRPLLEIVWFIGHRGPRITQQPASSTNAEGSSVSFSVGIAEHVETYQWFKDGISINGATNQTHWITVVRRSDAGSYTVLASSPYGETNSNPAILTVIADDTPPSLLCAYGTNNLLTIFVEFSEIVTNGSVLDNYAVFPTDGSDNLAIASAAYASGGTEDRRVVLVLDSATPIVPGRSYLLNAGDISDRFGNVVDPSMVIPIALYSREVFTISDPQVWKYNDSGNDLSNSWKEVNFDDKSWSSGLALLGFETAPLPEPLRTTLNRTNGFGASIRTYYFRTHFSYSGATGANVLQLRTILDDAAAIYLNGAEIFRLRLPPGPLDYMTLATGAAITDAFYEGPFNVCVTNLANGDNLLAVEVHQNGPNSGDLVFGLQLSATSPEPPPTCFARQPTNQIVNAGDAASFAVEYRCPYSTARWFKDGAAIAGATNLTYAIPFVRPADQGVYHLTVDGVDSAPAQLTVLSCCAPEVVAVYATNETVVLQFNEEAINGLDLGNFLVSAVDNSHDLALTSAAYTSGTNHGTLLLLRIDPTTPMQLDTPYNLYLEDLEDRFGNVIVPQTWPIARFSSSLIRLDASQQWRYETSGTDLSNAWYRLDYDDSSWPLGMALFDARRPPISQINGQPVRTMTPLSNSTATAQIPAHYFRTRFNHSGPVSNIISIRPFIDDGALYYLNGREIFRLRMPVAPTPIGYNTLATSAVGNPNFEGPYYIAVTNLVHGQNLLAVEVHQVSTVSPDLTFGTEFGLLLPEPLPRLHIALSPDSSDVILTWNGSAILEQTTTLNPAQWNEVEGASSGYRTARTGRQFFRLREFF